MGNKSAEMAFRTRRGQTGYTLEGVDGRSTAARRFREVWLGIEADLGGDLTEAQKALLARACTLCVWCEEQEAVLARGGDFDSSAYNGAANTLRRILADLGLHRVARDVTDLHSYIATKGQADA